jgi:hypothetical protein
MLIVQTLTPVECLQFREFRASSYHSWEKDKDLTQTRSYKYDPVNHFGRNSFENGDGHLAWNHVWLFLRKGLESK